MIIDCFGKLIEIKDYDIDGSKYVDCVIRKQRLLLLPEEKVRQAILLFLINYTEIKQNKYIFKVEHNNLDIAIYHKNIMADFQPTCSPLLIIEVKRKQEDVLKYESQLLNYLELNDCTEGILANCQQIYLYSKNNRFKKKFINLSMLNGYFANSQFDDEDIKFFKLARQGDIESFLLLVNKYGQNNRIRFICSNYNIPIDVFLVSQVNNYILFDFCGVYKKKQTKIHKNNFVKLISIF